MQRLLILGIVSVAAISYAATVEKPVIAATSPNPITFGDFALTVTGSGFAKNAVVYFAGAPLPTTWQSSGQVTATGTAIPLPGGIAAIKVVNPGNAAAASAPVFVPVRSVIARMSYADAARFLRIATWGPDPASIAHLQRIGRDAWLAEQFEQPATPYPDARSDTEGAGRLQQAFFLNALSGTDQLRQRVAFALSEILVASAEKDRRYARMLGYLRVLSNQAFGNFRDLLTQVTLNPGMGFFLDMVNNDKANPARNTVANENYARELMQLFTLGLVQLHDDGTPTTLPEYDEATVKDMAKVMTGWTYAPLPGAASKWRNPENALAPMVAFEQHHDTTRKTLNLPVPCTIAAGGTARADLDAALDCIAMQDNVAPFISYRLIQRLVMSNPSPGYVRNVATVFKSSKGDLRAVVTAILTDPEALAPGSGKIQEPVLFATSLLRSLDAKVTNPAGLVRQGTDMGQTVLAPPSVFSYFSPFYRTMGVPAPEFQGVNASTALGRINFVYATVFGGAGIRVDFANWNDLASNPGQLVEAINQALYRGQMSGEERSAVLASMDGVTDPRMRVRNAVYVAAGSPQYQVVQ